MSNQGLAQIKMGIIKDGINSARRYILNNFYDGSRQDAMDLFFGAYQIGMNSSMRIKDTEETLLFYMVPLVLLLSLLLHPSLPLPLDHLFSKAVWNRICHPARFPECHVPVSKRCAIRAVSSTESTRLFS